MYKSKMRTIYNMTNLKGMESVRFVIEGCTGGGLYDGLGVRGGPSIII